MSVFTLSFLYDCVYVYIVWFEYFFVFGMFYWDVFYYAWQGLIEEQSCTECFFTLYEYVWKKIIGHLFKLYNGIKLLYEIKYPNSNDI